MTSLSELRARDFAKGGGLRVEHVPRRSVVPERSPSRTRSITSSVERHLCRRADLDAPLPHSGRARHSCPAEGQPARPAGPGHQFAAHGRNAPGRRPGRHRRQLADAGKGQTHVTRVVLRNLLVLQAPSTETVGGKIGANPNEPFFALVAMTDAQAQKFWWIAQNGDWTFQLRPVSNASDSPDHLDTARTVALDGLAGRERRRATGGK